ncbi:MAG: aldehyde dehydrogenase family protein, partial [Polyangiaceae bacterium]
MRSAITEPWSGKHLADVELFSETRAKEAISASVVAFGKMRALSSYARKDILRRITRGIESRHEELSNLIAREAGKPIAQARAEVTRAISTFDIAAEEATRITGEVLPLDITKSSEGFRGEWSRFPRGPVLGISPFNFPLNLVAHKVA